MAQPPEISSREKTKVFHDPIHGQMNFHPYLVMIIDTPQFQRLRNIKQMGGAYFVYPGASHSRFEHSLGVAHLAGQLVRSLKDKQPELGIDEKDVLCVEIAGLCHDLGHGPFSHMFDDLFIRKRKPEKKWTHEKGSVDMLKYIVSNNEFVTKMPNLNLKDEEGSDLNFITEMIVGPNEKGKYTGRPQKTFLYEIVANKRNAIDMDKLDYFTRDFYHLGIKHNFDHCRFIKFARVIDVDGQKQICQRDKELSNMYEVFLTRNSIHRKVCQHKTLKVIDLMITEALIKAEKPLNISSAIQCMEEYTKLTDCIFEKILYSEKKDLTAARDILKKIVSRDLYKYLGKKELKENVEDEERLKKKWKKELVKQTTTQDDPQLKEHDFEIIITTFDFGMKEKNPIDHMHFYSKSDPNTAFKMSSEQVPGLIRPHKFSEKWINVYCRSSDKNIQNVAYMHFYQWCKDKDFLIPPNPPQSEIPEPQPKVFNDPVHGLMEFNPSLVKIIDTPQFQRLRFIKQLGGAYAVYPGASHNRFEHSLGVAHLAGQLVRSLKEKQSQINIDEKDILCVEIAGLCHDLGHGPYSEVFDQIFAVERSRVSADLFTELVDELNLDLTENDKIFIKEMIQGKNNQRQGREKDKYFLYDIVNKRNGVDVTVFDSVARDCYQLGLKTNFNHQRFIQHVKVSGDKSQLCIRDKLVSNLYDLFHTVTALHSKAYQHKVTMSIQLMMSNIVKEKMERMRRPEGQTQETEQQILKIYSRLTDSLFTNQFREKELEPRDTVMKRIHFRDLYIYLDVELGSEKTKDLAGEIAEKLGVTVEDIGIYVSTIPPENSSTKIIHGMKFYDKDGQEFSGEEIDEKRPRISKPEISPGQWIHVFYKKEEPDAEKKRMLKKRKLLSPEGFHTSCVKFMKCSFS